MYSRFTALEEFSREDLERIQGSTAVVVGLGATGSVIAEHLARHGVSLKLIDRDYLEENDLYSSNLYTVRDVEESLPKPAAAAEKLSQVTEVEARVASLGPGNTEILDGDIVLDGTDNLETRFLLDEYSQKNSVPWVYTAAVSGKGYSMMFGDSCFSCVFSQVKAGKLETCETSGVMREVAAMAASSSALKAVRRLAGKDVDESLDVLPDGHELDVENTGCEVCSGSRYPRLESQDSAVSVCGERKYELRRELHDRAFEKLRAAGKVEAENDFLVRASVKGNEFVLFRSGRAIVEAEDRGHAEQLFSETVGG